MAQGDVYTNRRGVTEVGIRKFRAELSRWLERVGQGEEVVVTERGRPIARLIGASRPSRMDELMAAGVIKPAKWPKQPAKRRGIKVRGSISDLVSEQRR